MRQGQAQRNHRGTKRLSSAAHLLLPGEKLLLPALCRGEARGHALVNSAELLADSTELLAHSVDLRARLLLPGENLLLPALRRGEARVHALINSAELLADSTDLLAELRAQLLLRGENLPEHLPLPVQHVMHRVHAVADSVDLLADLVDLLADLRAHVGQLKLKGLARFHPRWNPDIKDSAVRRSN